jgi:DNA-binding Lrp family transcriptional regulator
MTGLTSVSELAGVAATPRGRAMLISAAFVVDVANISRDGGDLLEPLVFAAIVQANQAPLRHDPAVARRYGDSGEALPDELRRPISINAVAHSLRLPFETVRRKVKRLAEIGQCVVTPAGAYVPQAVIVGERHATIQAARLARVGRLHEDLRAVGFLGPGQMLPRPPPAVLMRTVNRALSEYMLRSCDRMVELVKGVPGGFVLLGLGSANAGHWLTPAGAGTPATPCSTRALAARLGLPPETARRRLMALADAGFAVREEPGWLAAAPASEQERLARLAADNEADLKRLFARLKELAEAG